MIFDLALHPMRTVDIPAVLDIQASCYEKSLLESHDAFVSKQQASPASCFMAHIGDTAAGYLVSIPANANTPPALNSDVYQIPAKPDCLYLHDLAIAPNARGQGVADKLIAAFFRQLRTLEFKTACLTAVNDSASFWARYGFNPAALQGTARQCVATYGHSAQYMVREITK